LNRSEFASVIFLVLAIIVVFMGGLPVRKQKHVVEFIEEHLAEEISLATLAELVPKRISPSSREPGFQVWDQSHTHGGEEVYRLALGSHPVVISS
jgi:hypothetical protein